MNLIYDSTGKPSQWNDYLMYFYWGTRWGSYT